jgi:hypothetical protein
VTSDPRRRRPGNSIDVAPAAPAVTLAATPAVTPAAAPAVTPVHAAAVDPADVRTVAFIG